MKDETYLLPSSLEGSAPLSAVAIDAFENLLAIRVLEPTCVSVARTFTVAGVQYRLKFEVIQEDPS